MGRMPVFSKRTGFCDVRGDCGGRLHRANSLAAGGLKTTQNPVPNMANAYAVRNNKDLIKNRGSVY